MIIRKDGEYLISKGSVVLVAKSQELFDVKKFNKCGKIYKFYNKGNGEIDLIYIGSSTKGGLIFETTQDIKSNEFGRISGGFAILNDGGKNTFLLNNVSESDVSAHIPNIKSNMNFLIKKFMSENNISFCDVVNLNDKAFKRHIRLNKIIN